MRKVLIPVAAVALAIAAAALGGRGEEAAAAPDAASCTKANLDLVRDGRLTIGTDNPAYPPWFAGGETKGRPWKINDPAKGKGFEPAVAYAVAKRLGFAPAEVSWVYSPFNKTIAPGRKAFDFAINQISYSPERARALTFSAGYYFVNQSVVGVKGKPIASVRSIAGLRRYKLGAQLGTTSYQYIVRNIKPGPSVAVYDTNDAAVAALRNGQIDGLVVDLPTAFYVTAAQVPNSTIIGQFPSVGTRERFGMVGRFGLADKRDDYPDRLSGGQQQRVAIVRALALKPEVMLLDEVTSALDPELVAEVLNVIRELAEGGMTMLIATHEMGFARDIASRVCFLDAGVILEQGPPETIFSAPAEPRTRQFLDRIIEAGRL